MLITLVVEWKIVFIILWKIVFTIVVRGILLYQSMESIFCIVVKKLFLLLKICPSGVVFYECGRAADIDRVGPLH